MICINMTPEKKYYLKRKSEGYKSYTVRNTTEIVEKMRTYYHKLIKNVKELKETKQ